MLRNVTDMPSTTTDLDLILLRITAISSVRTQLNENALFDSRKISNLTSSSYTFNGAPQAK